MAQVVSFCALATQPLVPDDFGRTVGKDFKNAVRQSVDELCSCGSALHGIRCKRPECPLPDRIGSPWGDLGREGTARGNVRRAVIPASALERGEHASRQYNPPTRDVAPDASRLEYGRYFPPRLPEGLQGPLAGRDIDCRHGVQWVAPDACDGAAAAREFERRHVTDGGARGGGGALFFNETMMPALSPRLWWMGQLARLKLHALGSCGRMAQRAMLGRVRTVGLAVDSGPAIGMHIRRGDACRRWAEDEGDMDFDQGGRPCWKMGVYMRAAMQFRRLYNASRIILATDSDCVVQHEIHRYTDDFQFTYIEYNRTETGGVINGRGCDTDDFSHRDGEVRGGAEEAKYFIEHRPLTDTTRAELFASAYADYALMARDADMFVGAAISSFLQIGLFANIGTRGVVPPYIFIDGWPKRGLESLTLCC